MKIKRSSWLAFAMGVGLGWFTLTCLIFNRQVQHIIDKQIVEHIYKTNTQFCQDSLIAELKDLNIKFPHIVLAQAQIETGHFTSKIFKQNNNLFGLREAKARVTTAKGTKRGHAWFDTWRESILDYAFMQCRYMKFNNESEYYAYLGKNYAESPGYVDAVKKQATKNKKYFK